ncbi:MAG: DMT family transporter [Candidatus Cloacimonadaceae bacterium]
MKDNNLSTHLYCVIAIFFFSTIEVVGKLIGTEISPYGITAWRFLIGGLLLLPFALKERTLYPVSVAGKDYLKFALAGVLNVCISMLFLQLSIFYGKAVLSAVIVSTNTLFVAIFAFFFLKERITKLHMIGLGLGLLGLFFIIYGERVLLSQSRNLVLGVAYGLAAALTFAIYTVYSKKLVVHFGNFTTLSYTFIFGAILLFSFSVLTGKEVLFAPNLKNIVLILYLSVFVTGLAYILYFSAIKRIGAAKASLYFFLKPAVAAILAWLLHRETINLMQLFGIIIIMLSLSREAVIRFLHWNSLLRKA